MGRRMEEKISLRRRARRRFSEAELLVLLLTFRRGRVHLLGKREVERVERVEEREIMGMGKMEVEKMSVDEYRMIF
jgi:hypothetical protein